MCVCDYDDFLGSSVTVEHLSAVNKNSNFEVKSQEVLRVKSVVPAALTPKPTVDGRNPKQPPNMYETLQIMGYLPYQLVSRISEPSTV